MTNVVGDSANPSVPAVVGKHSANGIGVSASSEQGWAVRADAKKDTAVFATSDAGMGIDARSNANTGILASSQKGIGVHGKSEQGWAVRAEAKKDTAVVATSDAGVGIDARSNANTGIFASSKKGIGVHGIGGKYAGYFEGIVMVTGDIQLQNADCAEDFEVSATETVEAGAVMALNDIGQLEQGKQPYDKRVAGVVSGAGDLKPGLVLGRQPGHADRVPLALMGRVHCKVDANYESIEVGDLLTTSATPGHAMKASDPTRSFGAVIGKALRPLKTGKDLIPILVALQ